MKDLVDGKASMRQLFLLFKNRRVVSGLPTDKIMKGDQGGEWGQ
jgi:hypothetical protein